MQLETLFLAGSGVALLNSLAFYLFWLGDRRRTVLAVWATALLLQSVSCLLFAIHTTIPEPLRIAVANGGLLLASGLMLSAVRSLGGQRVPVAAFLPAAIWLLACAVPGFQAAWAARVLLFALLSVAVDGASIKALWDQGGGKVPSRRLGMLLFGLHGVAIIGNATTFFLADPATLIDPSRRGDRWPPAAFTILSLVGVWPTMSLALLAMVKERVDLALHESGALLRKIAEALDDGLAVSDAARQEFLYTNPGVPRLAGLSPDSLPARWADLLEIIHPEDRPRVRALIQQPADIAFDTQYRIRRADGAERWIRHRRVPAPGAIPSQVVAVFSDVTAEREAAERQLLLAREVDHRAKNVLAVVQSILRLTRADSPAAYASAVSGRIEALARAHGLLSRGGWAGTDLGSLLAQEFAPYAGGAAPAESAPRWATAGPCLSLRPEAVQPLAMALHELTTNSAKYGALSVPEGGVRISWTLAPREAGGPPWLLLDWEEAGGPPVAGAPARAGFGSRVVRQTVERQLGGAVGFEWEPEGLRCRLAFPADKVLVVAPREQAGAVMAKSA